MEPGENIIFKENEIPSQDALVDLYTSVNWGHKHFSDLLLQAYRHSDFVVSASLSSGELIGLGRALSDNAFTAYFPDLLIKPEWQGMGIGKKILRIMLEKYKNYHNVVLIAEDEKARSFYLKCGFQSERNALSILNPFKFPLS